MAFYIALEDGQGQRIAELWLGHRDRSYVLANGHCPVYQQIAWCWACRAYCAAERLRDLSEIDADEAKTRKEYGWFQETLRGPNDVQPWLIKQREFLFAEDLAGYARERSWRQRGGRRRGAWNADRRRSSLCCARARSTRSRGKRST